MSEPIVVNQSTSVVQVDTSTVVYPNSAVVLLSSITAPGTIITIRDITGYASTNRGIAVSTTAGVHYLDGPGCNVYNINQPYGFLTVTPRTSNVWAVINTFAFPDQAAHPSVEGIDARRGNFSNLSGNTGSFNNLTVYYSTFMNVATVSSVLARSISTQSIAVSSNISAVNISTTYAQFSSVNINNPLTPSTSLEVNGSIRANTIFLTNSAYVRGSLVYNTNNIVSTVQGLGTATYVSTASLASTVRGLGTATYISSPSVVSTVQGLGTATYISSPSLVSTVQGLGTATYISSPSLVSTVQGLGTATYISSSSLVSTVEGLGSAGYLSSPVTGLISSIIGLGSSGIVSTTMMASTVIGLGSSRYVSSTGLFSTVQGLGSSQYVSGATMASTVIGLGTANYISSPSLVSTVQGLGTATYISSPSLVSTVQGLGTATYISSPSLVSTVQGLGNSSYISSASLVSTVQGLGSSGYISTPNVLISSLSTHSLVVYGPSTFVNASNLFIGASISTNTLRFLGTYKDGFDEPTKYTTTVIAERIYDEGLITEESSELLLFKGNDGTLPVTYAPGPDRVRVLAAGGFQVDIASNGGIWPIGGQPPSTTIKAFTINCNGYVGIGCNMPAFTLDVAGTINACNIGINGSLLVTTSNLVSTIKGLGTDGYVSTTGLFSTVQGLGSSEYISSTGLASTVQGLGTAGYLSSVGTALASTVQGLGSSSYVSSTHLASTVQGLGTSSYISSGSLVSSVQGLGTAGYISSIATALASTVQGLGSSSYVSSAHLASTVQGLGSSSYVSSAHLASTVQGLGSSSYVSSAHLASTVQGLGSSSYISSPSLVSTVQGLGTATYISSPSLVSTVQGLGSSGYISTPNVLISSLSTHSLVVYGPSTFINASNLFIGASVSTNLLRFLGTYKDGFDEPTKYTTTVIGERIYDGGLLAEESSELLLFKGNDGTLPVTYAPGPDRVRVLAAGGFQVDIASNGGSWPIGGQPPTTAIQAFYIGCNGRVGINCNSPSYTLDVQGSINVSGTINAYGFVNSDNLASTVQGLGSSQYISSTGMLSTVQGLGSSQYISSASLASTVEGLGSSQYISSASLASTVEGLGSSQYISSASLASTVQGLGSSQYISSASLASTVEGLGTAGYISSTSFVSTVQGLGSSSYISSPSLVSTVEGLGSSSYISSPSLVSTVQGLGSSSYISSPSLVSTVQGLGTATYISSLSLVSTVQGLGTATYISSASLASTVQGLGSSGYISTPNVLISSLSTHSLTVYGPSTFINASNLFIGASISTNVMRFLGTYKDGFDEPSQYTTTVIGERIYDDGVQSEQSSELLLFKGNDGTLPVTYAPGPDRVRILAAGGFQVDIASNGGNWPVGGQPPTTAIQAFYIGCNGRVGINCNSPSYTLDVQGSINVSGTINAYGFVNSDNLNSTVRGLGTATYISSPSLASTVQGLGTASYISSSSLASTVQGLGQIYLSSPVTGLVSSVQGLGSSSYISSSSLASTVQGLGTASYISSSSLASTVQGLGQIYLSSPVTGLVSSVQGLGSSSYISSTGLASTVQGLGTASYISSSSLASTVQGLGQIYLSSPVTGLISTVQGLGSSRYISSPIVSLSTLSTQSLIAFGESTFLFSSNVYIGNSLSTNILRFYGTTAVNSFGSNQYARTVIAERSFSNPDTSELLLFKANNALGVPGPDNVRVLAAGGFQVDIASNGGVWPINGNPPSTVIRAFTVNSNGYVGIGCNSPISALDVNGIMNVSSNIFVNGLPVLTSGVDTDSNYVSTSNFLIGAGPSTNTLRFIGTRFDGFNEGNARKFTHSVIGERIYATEELSELLIFKGDNTGSNSWGPDRVRVLSAGGFVVDISPEGCNWPVNSEPPPAAISNAFSIGRDGVIRTASTILINGSRVVTSGGGGGSTSFASNVGINCNSPEYTLDVGGFINARCNIYVNGNPVVTSGGAGGAIVLSCNVGINCNSPAYTLDVNGCLNVSGCNVATYQWIALGTGVDKILKSSDGYVWSPVSGETFTTSGSRVAWNGSNLWIAVGTGANTILSSTNGNTWATVTGPTFTAGNDVVWNGTNLWVAVGGGNAANSIWRSADGDTWTASSTGFSSGGFGIATSGSYWVAVGNGGSTPANQKYSGDGIAWSNATGGGGFSNSSGGRDVAFNGSNMWVAVGYGSTAANTILYSTSGGQIWNNAVTGGFSGYGTSIAWNGSLWVATGSHSSAAGNIQISLDGMNWLPSLTGAFSGGATGVVWSGTKFIATGTGTSPILYSDDGRNWSSCNVTDATFTAGLGIGYGRTLTGPLYALTVSGDTYINGALYINGVPAGAAVSGSGGAGGGTSGGGGGSLPINIELVSSLLGIFGRVGVGCNSPSYTMDVNGTINASSNIFINGSPLLAASSLYSTVRGLGSASYVSTTQMNALINNTFISSIQGLGSYGYVSSLSNLSNINNVNSLQGVFSSIGVNCNLPAYTMDVNGTINASSNVFINGSSLLPASSLYSTVRGLGTAGYVSSLVNVNSLQGVFSSIGVNCNLPAHRLDINGKLNVSGDPSFGLIQTQGTAYETVSFYLDPVNAGTPVNTGWITGQTTTTGVVGAANITTFGVTRVNNSILSQYGYYMNSNGRFGINANNPAANLHVNGLDATVPALYVGGSNGFGLIQLQGGGAGLGQETGIYSKDCFVGGTDGNSGWYYGQSHLNGATLSNFIIRRINTGGTAQTPTVQITPAGYVGINTANPTYPLHVSGIGSIQSLMAGAITCTGLSGFTAGVSFGYPTVQNNGYSVDVSGNLRATGLVNLGSVSAGAITCTGHSAWTWGAGFTPTVSIGYATVQASGIPLDISGNIRVTGSIAKGSSTFTIDHPVVPSTILIHSVIEGPRCDLIYRNRKQLSNGYAEIDIEKECTANDSTMSPGTFDALCTNPQTFLQNNETFDRVKGYVSSHMLFITCENPESTATIDWQVIAERHDPFIKNWNMTDSNGLLILEHPKLV